MNAYVGQLAPNNTKHGTGSKSWLFLVLCSLLRTAEGSVRDVPVDEDFLGSPQAA